MRAVAILIALVMLSPFGATATWAHLTPNSEVRVDFGSDRVVMDIIIPQGEYAYATGNPLRNDQQSVARALQFLESHVSLTSPDGRKWEVRFDNIEFVQIAGPPDLHAIATATPPANAPLRRFDIGWTAILDTNPGHSVLFVARQDFSGGKHVDRREILGALQGERRMLSIDRGTPKPFGGFLAAIALGMEHIAAGHDHLLFLIALIIPLPLLASGSEWSHRTRSVRTSLWLVLKIATAFTIGHSITLIGAAFLGWQLPAQPVEILIAISILISAIHAIRPIFANREPLIAGGFGLIHGLAFATIIGGYGLDAKERALTILGFNIGIELVQLLVISSVIPAIFILARRPFYAIVRNTIAMFIVVAALAWLVERITETINSVTVMLDAVLSQGLWIIFATTLAAVLFFAIARRKQASG
jgi:HupE / UreJ protein